MNIMQIVSGPRVNGAVLHSLLLTRELARRGHQLTMVCRPGAWIGRQLADAPVEVIHSDLHRWPRDELRRIAELVRSREVDAIHTHQSRAHFFGILLRWLTGVPCVATAHSRHIQLHWMFNDRVVAVSEATRRYHRTFNLVRDSRIETVPNFIDYRRFVEVPPQTRERVRWSLRIDEDAPVLGVVGNVEARKGLRYLVHAMPAVLAAEPRTRLLVIGPVFDEHFAAETKADAKRLGVTPSIIWTGSCDEVHKVLSAVDLFVLPSLEESLPLTILEAMAAGLPVVSTTVGGIPECVDDGVTGTLVPPADSRALAEAILRLVASPESRRQMGEAGRRLVLGQFSPKAVIPRIESVFSRVTARRRAA